MSNVPDIKQVLLNRISVLRLKTAKQLGNAAAYKQATQFYAGLTVDETTFAAIEVDPTRTNGYKATITSESRGWVLDDQRWVQGTLAALLTPLKAADILAADAPKILYPGIYIATDTNEVFIVAAEEATIDDIFALIGYSFEADKYTYADKEFVSTSEIIAGKATVEIAPDAAGKGGLTIAADKTDLVIGVDPAIITATVVDADNKPIAGSVVHFTVIAGKGNFDNSQQTTDANGIAAAKFAPVTAGALKVETNIGLFVRSNVLAFNATAPVVTYTVLNLTVTPEEISAGDSVIVKGQLVASDGSSVLGQTLDIADTSTGHHPLGVIEPDVHGNFEYTVTLTAAGNITLTLDDGEEVAGEIHLKVNPDLKTAMLVVLGVDAPKVIAGQDFALVGTVADRYNNNVGGAKVDLVIDGVVSSVNTDNVGIARSVNNFTKVGTYAFSGKVGQTATQTGEFKVEADVASAKVDSVTTDAADLTKVPAGTAVTFNGKTSDQYANITPGVTVTCKVDNGVPTTALSDTNGLGSFKQTLTLAGDHAVSLAVGSTAAVVTNVKVLADLTSSSFKDNKIAADKSSLAAGATVTVTGTIVDKYTNPLAGVQVTVLTNGKDGKVGVSGTDGKFSVALTPTATGTYPLKASLANAANASVNVTVTFDPASSKVTALTLSSTSVVVGDKVTAGAVVADQYGNALNNVDVVFTDGTNPVTVKTDNAGKASADFTMAAEGVTTLSAKYGTSAAVTKDVTVGAGA